MRKQHLDLRRRSRSAGTREFWHVVPPHRVRVTAKRVVRTTPLFQRTRSAVVLAGPVDDGVSNGRLNET